jgi:hypothetical protein
MRNSRNKIRNTPEMTTALIKLTIGETWVSYERICWVFISGIYRILT